MKEEWKIIKDFPNYEVSSNGIIKNRNTNKILKQHIDKDGYLKVILFNNSGAYNHYVHRLVAITFIPNPDSLPIINHKDEDKTNNNLDNLEWCSAKYNANYGDRNNKIRIRQSKPVYQCNNDGDIIAWYPSASEAARQIAGNLSCICDCCKGYRKHHKGFVWKYAEKDEVQDL